MKVCGIECKRTEQKEERTERREKEERERERVAMKVPRFGQGRNETKKKRTPQIPNRLPSHPFF
jgi:hypothetical protein